MGVARRHGTWSKIHDGMDEHPKTAAAAAVLAAALGVDRDLAAAVVVRAVGRLVRWAIRESDGGRTGHLRDAQVLAIGWPAAVEPGGVLWGKSDLSVLRRALREIPEGFTSGFLADVSRGRGRSAVEVIHEFHLYAWEVLRDRPHYKGTRQEDWLASPLGPTETAGRGGGSEPGTAVPPPSAPIAPGGAAGAGDAPAGSTGATLGGAPLVGLSDADAAAIDPLQPAGTLMVLNLSRMGGGTPHRTGGLSSADLSGEPPATLSRNPLPANDPLRAGSARDPARAPRAFGSVPAAKAAESQSGDLNAAAWRGVPPGVRRGEADAVAEWTRSVAPISHARLYAGAAYVERLEQTAGIVPPEAARDSALTPGAALEIAAPEAWAGLQADLISHLPGVAFPRKYTARAIAQRWESVLSKAADAAVARRAQWRQSGRA